MMEAVLALFVQVMSRIGKILTEMTRSLVETDWLRSVSFRNVLLKTSFLGAVSLFLNSEQVFAGERLGVLLSSYGDIDSPQEAESYVKKAILDPDIAPIPDLMRGFISTVGWQLLKRSIEDEYRRIGATNYRRSSASQAQILEAQLVKMGLNAKVYTGFVFTYPYIKDTLSRMQADGVERFIVINQGAQYSAVTQEINFREVRKYLRSHPEWYVRGIGLKSFSEDKRFVNLITKSIKEGLAQNFQGISEKDVCLFLPLHGLAVSLPLEGDPAYSQMLKVVNQMRIQFPKHSIYYGFQNHDEFPGSKWTEPNSDMVAHLIGKTKECKHTLINGRISFTVDNLETLFDQAVAQKEAIQKGNPNGKVVVLEMFNSQKSFIELLRDLTVEALRDEGDIIQL